ncbi:hypothetical protein AB0I54_41180 [Streptomyces sp. NPDC050625]|uniref:hypothetical protein n=1 Tax=Streptomyces sp. NPDC050625 TaxID=3154629 RepID=UPI00341573C3
MATVIADVDTRSPGWSPVASSSPAPRAASATPAHRSPRGFNAALHSSRAGGPLQRLGAAPCYESSIDDRVREMVILLITGRYDCAVERVAHQ